MGQAGNATRSSTVRQEYDVQVNNIIVTIMISVMSIIVIPLLVSVFRAALRWKGIEDKLEKVVTDIREIVDDKNRIHTELVGMMREDREATNRRLRWLEENLWNTRRGR